MPSQSKEQKEEDLTSMYIPRPKRLELWALNTIFMQMLTERIDGLAKVWVLAMLAGSGFAAPVPVPNHSFERPDVPEVAPLVEAWTKTPKPDWFVEAPPEQLWGNLVGVFENPPTTNSSHIPNMEGRQALYLFNIPQAGLFQELEATYAAGKVYELKFGAIGGGGGMPPGATLLASLYYRDEASNPVAVAALPVAHTTNLFPSTSLLVDVAVRTPKVEASDAWAGKKIGIMLVSTSGQEVTGGYWDIDNVRLTVAEPIPVANGSFELPDVPEVAPFVEAWTKTPKPEWFVEVPPEQLWGNLVGVFENPPATNSSHIPNMEGRQALYLFNVPQAGLFQELEATYEPGKAYTFTAGAIGGGGGMPEGAGLLLSFYYWDAAGNKMTVAAAPVLHATNLFPATTILVDIAVKTPAVKASDPWAGQKIGVMLMSTSGQQFTGGYWDLDNARVTAEAAVGASLTVAREGSNVRVSWTAENGKTYQLQVTENLREWTNLNAPVSGTGQIVSRTAGTSERARAFFRVVQTE